MFKRPTTSSLFVLQVLCFVLIPIADTRIFLSLPLYYLDVVLLLLLCATLYQTPGTLFSFIKQRKVIFVGVLAFFVALSALVNSPSLSTLGFFKSWFLLPVLAFTYYFATQREEQETPKLFLKAWFIGLLFLLLLTLYFVLVGEYTFDGRLVGAFASPNFLGYLLFPGALIAYYFLSQYKKLKWRALAAVIILLFLGGLLLTQSLGALLALLVATGVYVVPRLLGTLPAKGISRVILYLVFALLILSPLFFLANEQAVHAITGERSSLSSRLMIWRSAAHSTVDNPIWGIGLGNFQKVYLAYQPQFPPYLEWAVPQPHNFFLALWLQYGLLGTITLMYIIWSSVKSLTKETISEERRLLVALLVGSLVYGIFDTPLFGNALAFIWWGNLLVLFFWPEQKEKSLLF
jgi:O-antigen ligase